MDKRWCTLGLVFLLGCGDKTITGNSGDNKNNVQVQVVVDGTLIQEIVKLVKMATPSPIPTPMPTATPSISPSPCPGANCAPTSTPIPTPMPTATPSPIPTPSSCMPPMPSPHPVAWWTGNGHGLDHMGQHHGQLQDISFVPGLFDQAFALDGTGHLTIGDHPQLRITEELTITAWIHVQAIHELPQPLPNKDMGILSKKSSLIANHGYAFAYNPATKTLTLAGSGQDVATVKVNIKPNHWHHVAGTISTAVPARKSPNKQAKLFVDGEIALANGKVTPLKASSSPLYLGQISPGWGTFEGKLDDVMLFDQALNPSEIKALAHRKCP